MTIEILDQSNLNLGIEDRVKQLFKQLNANIDQLPLAKVLAEGDNIIFVLCHIDGSVVGMASMALYKVISGHKGMVEDVVVDEGHRGKGIGRKLMEALLEEAKKRNLDEILLFSGHHRLPAIGLYKSLGFKQKESGIYNLKFS